MEIYDTPIDGALEYEDIDEKDCESDPKAKVLPLNASAATPSTSDSENNYSKAPGYPLSPIPQQTYDRPRPVTPKQMYDLIGPHQPYDSITLQQTHENRPLTLQKVCGYTFLKSLSLNKTNRYMTCTA